MFLPSTFTRRDLARPLLLAVAGALFLLPAAYGASCTTESQMTPGQRDALSTTAHTLAAEVQSGDVQALRSNTIAPVAAQFGGIADTVGNLKPMLQNATLTVDDLYILDGSDVKAGTPETQFFCGLPGSMMMVVLTFNDLPSGKYAFAIVHATGVPKPQQIVLVLNEAAPNHWMLAGFSGKPMTLAGHDGIWYWTHARQYTKQNDEWSAWFYYQAANYLLEPVDYLSSPNLEKLRNEIGQIHATGLPSGEAVPLTANGESFQLTGVETTSELGPLDLSVYYVPTAAQAAQLRNPVAARQQVTAVMTALLAQHPGLQEAFHGIWVHANQGDASIFALELPMNQIAGSSLTPAAH